MRPFTLPSSNMTGSGEGSGPEVIVSRARQAITLDLVERTVELLEAEFYLSE